MNTTYTWTNGINLTSGTSPEPSRVPKGLIATRAVELKDGWTGQVTVAETVVDERSGFRTSHDAEAWATGRVIKAVTKILTPKGGKSS